MKLNERIKIDLLEFFRTGKFDYLKPGQTKQWIINNFPDPDDKFDYNAPIWVYGDIELHFNGEDKLFLIYSDYIDTLDGGNSLALDKWIFKEPEKLTLEYVIEHLNIERIGFKVVHRVFSLGFITSVIEILDSKISLGFEPAEYDNEDSEAYLLRSQTADPNKFKLVSFSLMN